MRGGSAARRRPECVLACEARDGPACAAARPLEACALRTQPSPHACPGPGAAVEPAATRPAQGLSIKYFGGRGDALCVHRHRPGRGDPALHKRLGGPRPGLVLGEPQPPPGRGGPAQDGPGHQARLRRRAGAGGERWPRALAGEGGRRHGGGQQHLRREPVLAPSPGQAAPAGACPAPQGRARARLRDRVPLQRGAQLRRRHRQGVSPLRAPAAQRRAPLVRRLPPLRGRGAGRRALRRRQQPGPELPRRRGGPPPRPPPRDHERGEGPRLPGDPPPPLLPLAGRAAPRPAGAPPAAPPSLPRPPRRLPGPPGRVRGRSGPGEHGRPRSALPRGQPRHHAALLCVRAGPVLAPARARAGRRRRPLSEARAGLAGPPAAGRPGHLQALRAALHRGAAPGCLAAPQRLPQGGRAVREPGPEQPLLRRLQGCLPWPVRPGQAAERHRRRAASRAQAADLPGPLRPHAPRRRLLHLRRLSPHAAAGAQAGGLGLQRALQRGAGRAQAHRQAGRGRPERGPGRLPREVVPAVRQAALRAAAAPGRLVPGALRRPGLRLPCAAAVLRRHGEAPLRRQPPGRRRRGQLLHRLPLCGAAPPEALCAALGEDSPLEAELAPGHVQQGAGPLLRRQLCLLRPPPQEAPGGALLCAEVRAQLPAPAPPVLLFVRPGAGAAGLPPARGPGALAAKLPARPRRRPPCAEEGPERLPAGRPTLALRAGRLLRPRPGQDALPGPPDLAGADRLCLRPGRAQPLQPERRVRPAGQRQQGGARHPRPAGERVPVRRPPGRLPPRQRRGQVGADLRGGVRRLRAVLPGPAAEQRPGHHVGPRPVRGRDGDGPPRGRRQGRVPARVAGHEVRHSGAIGRLLKMSAGLAGAALSPPAAPEDEAHGLYAARVRKCMLSVNVCLEQRTFRAFFGLAARTLELTGDPDVLADTIQKSLGVEEGRAAALGDGVARGRREAEARGSRPLGPGERRLLERYGACGAAERPAADGPPRGGRPQAVDAIAGSLVEVSLSSLGALSAPRQPPEACSTLWVVPHAQAPGSGDGLLADLSVFAEGVSLSEFALGEPPREVRGFAARFPTVYAARLCAYSVCQRNFLVGQALRRSSVYAYAAAPEHDLRALSECVDGTPAVSDVELSGSSSGAGAPADEPPIKRAQRRTVPRADVEAPGAARAEQGGAPRFGDPACVVRLTGIPDAYRGPGFRRLKILKGKTPPDRVLHGEEGGEYVMYIGFKHAAPLQKFAEACKRVRDTVGIRAAQGRVPGDCSGLEALDPGDVWCGAGAPAEAAQGPVVEVANLPRAYRDLGEREEFWCGEHRPLLWWNLLSRVVQDAGGSGALYFCFKYRDGKEASSAKWFRKRLSSVLREEGVSGVSVTVLDGVPPELECRDVELPAPRP